MQRWMKAVLKYLDPKIRSTVSEKTSKAADDILKVHSHLLKNCDFLFGLVIKLLYLMKTQDSNFVCQILFM